MMLPVTWLTNQDPVYEFVSADTLFPGHTGLQVVVLIVTNLLWVAVLPIASKSTPKNGSSAGGLASSNDSAVSFFTGYCRDR